MVAPLPPGVVGSEGRFEFYHRSYQAYLGIMFTIVGLAGIIGPAVFYARRSNASIVILIVPTIFALFVMAGAFFLCYRFKWSKLVMDFNQRQLQYITASFPFILCRQPDKALPIAHLGTISIRDSGLTEQSNRRKISAVKVLELRIDLANDDYVNLACEEGEYNIQPIMNKWTAWLKDQGIAVNSGTLGAAQLIAILPSMAQQQQPMLVAKAKAQPQVPFPESASRKNRMVAPLPPGVVGSGGKFEYSHRSSQVYFGLIFGTIGLIVPIAIIATQAPRVGQFGFSPAIFIVPVIIAIIFGGVGVFFCYKFKWSKFVMDFNQRQVRYITAAFPFILCQEPNKTAPIDQLGNMVVHETGVSQGGRRGYAGTPILELRIDLGNGEFIPIASVAGHFNVAPVMTKWTLWLQDMGVNVNTALAALAGPQLMAIMPMTQQPMLMMSQPSGVGGTPMMYAHPMGGSPMNGGGGQPMMMYPGSPMMMMQQQQQQPPPPPMPMYGYPGGGAGGTPMYNGGGGGGGGLPPPPPPLHAGSPAGFVDYNNLNGNNTSAGTNNQQFSISTQPPVY